MPRRNARVDFHRPLDVTPDHKPKSPEVLKAAARRTTHARQVHEIELAERQKIARVDGAIDWSICLVPGCGEELIRWGLPEHPPHRRDSEFELPNHLIKVGWTRDLSQRLKSYGASVEVLMHYPGTRDDETTLHRQLRPALARGREWYEDGPIIQRFIADALKRYGEPAKVGVYWTKPKQVVAGKRHR